MIPFHSLCPEVAQREVRCIHVGAAPADQPSALPPDEYVYLELYCAELDCDCRRVFLEVIAREQPGKIFASIIYGWEKEAFYAKRMPWDPASARQVVRGELDPISEQSEFAETFLDLFRRFVLDDPYRLRLRRHYRLFKDELRARLVLRQPGRLLSLWFEQNISEAVDDLLAKCPNHVLLQGASCTTTTVAPRSADFQSAVSPNCIRQSGVTRGAAEFATACGLQIRDTAQRGGARRSRNPGARALAGFSPLQRVRFQASRNTWRAA